MVYASYPTCMQEHELWVWGPLPSQRGFLLWVDLIFPALLEAWASLFRGIRSDHYHAMIVGGRSFPIQSREVFHVLAAFFFSFCLVSHLAYEPTFSIPACATMGDIYNGVCKCSLARNAWCKKEFEYVCFSKNFFFIYGYRLVIKIKSKVQWTIS